jgi:hypothetical protein
MALCAVSPSPNVLFLLATKLFNGPENRWRKSMAIFERRLLGCKSQTEIPAAKSLGYIE